MNINVSRDSLGEVFKNQGYTIGAEIGVEQGKFSEVLLKANPDLTLYMVDPWKSFDGKFVINNGEVIESTQEIIDIFYENTAKRVREYKNAIIVRKFSMEAVRKFEDESLDFVYIDADHSFDNVMIDIIEWSKKVRPGGIVSGHDYTESNRNEVKTFKVDGKIRTEFQNAMTPSDVKLAVDTYAKAHKIDLHILTKDNYPTWLFEKI